jgi:hypothetical protein
VDQDTEELLSQPLTQSGHAASSRRVFENIPICDLDQGGGNDSQVSPKVQVSFGATTTCFLDLKTLR